MSFVHPKCAYFSPTLGWISPKLSPWPGACCEALGWSDSSLTKQGVHEQSVIVCISVGRDVGHVSQLSQQPWNSPNHPHPPPPRCGYGSPLHPSLVHPSKGPPTPSPPLRHPKGMPRQVACPWDLAPPLGPSLGGVCMCPFMHL